MPSEACQPDVRWGRSRRLLDHCVTRPMPSQARALKRAERVRARGSSRGLPIRNGRPLVPQAPSTHRAGARLGATPVRASSGGEARDSQYLINGQDPGFFGLGSRSSRHDRDMRTQGPAAGNIEFILLNYTLLHICNSINHFSLLPPRSLLTEPLYRCSQFTLFPPAHPLSYFLPTRAGLKGFSAGGRTRPESGGLDRVTLSG